MMESWLYWTFGGCAIAIAFIGVFLLLVGLDKTKEGLTVTGVIAFFIAAGLAGAAVTGRALQESDDLMDRLSWDGPRDFVVVSVGDEGFCGVLRGDDDVVCVPNTAVINYNRETLGAPKVLPIVGDYYSLKRTKVAGEEGKIIAYVPR